MDISTLVKPALIAIGAYMLYQNAKNPIVSGVAITALSMIVLRHVPVVNEVI